MKLKPWSVTLVLVIAVMALAALNIPSARAQSSAPREEMWVTNGSVGAIVTTTDTVYIGGVFTYVGPATGGGIPIDVSTAAPASEFPKVNGWIFACVPDGLGGWYIGGNFDRVAGVVRNNIAHILANGSVDPTWNPNASSEIRALAVSGSTVYAGGWFTNIGGQTRNHIAALDATTGAATDWNPNADNLVTALAVSGSTVYAGGKFNNIGGQTRYYIAALDAATGAATDCVPNANNQVLALAVSGSTVYAGGYFTRIGGQTRNYIAAIDATTTGAATAWNPNAGDIVFALAVSGSTVYAGGYFTSIGRRMRNNIAALDTVTGTATDWNPNANGTGVRALAVSGSTVYAGGGFTSIGGQLRSNIAALDAVTGDATDWNPNASGGYYDSYIYTLAVSGSTVYAGGEFTSIGGQTRSYIAALDTATTGAATAWNPNADGTVYALAVSGSTVYAGGTFNSIGGLTRNHIAALDAATGDATEWNPNANYEVSALAVSGSTIYAGGWFTNIGGQERNNIAALDAATGAATDWNPDAFGGDYYHYVYALAVFGSTVYAGGDFTSIGGDKSRSDFAQFGPELTPTPTPTLTPTPTPFVTRPHLVGAIFNDANGNGNAEPGEGLTLVFDQGVTITKSLTPDYFYLHVKGDSLGLEGFSASINPYSSRELILILGQGAHLTIEGDFLITMTQLSSPSGIDLDLSIGRPKPPIFSLDGVDCIDLGEQYLNDTGLDIKYSFRAVLRDIGSDGGTLDNSGDPDAAYHHSFYIPGGSISSSLKVKADPGIQFIMKSPDIPPPLPGCDMPSLPGGAIQILANADNIKFLTSATLTLQYLDGDVDIENGFAGAGMRIYMCVLGEDGCWHWVPVPGEQVVDTENNTVTVHLGYLKYPGTTGGLRLASPGESGIFGNLPGSTIEESTINMKPQGGGMVRILVGPTLAPGAGGFYTYHRIEFPNYVVTDPSDPDVIKVTIKQATLADRTARSGGNSFPTASSALFVVLTKNVSDQLIPFNSPVNIRVQFMDGTANAFKDVWNFDNTAGEFNSMAIVKDTVTGTGVNFQFIQGVTQSVTHITGGGYVEGSGITGLTDSQGKGVWGAVTNPLQQNIKRYLLGLDSDPTGLDLNGDGKVDIADIVWYLIGHPQAK